MLIFLLIAHLPRDTMKHPLADPVLHSRWRRAAQSNPKRLELRGFAPNGILECWNTGSWVILGMIYWEIHIDEA